MNKEFLRNLKLAGRIAARALKVISSKIKPGMKVLEICESLERFIRKQDAMPSFPVNVSINEIAAHYTSPYGDRTILRNGDIVKIDLGACIAGALSDTAKTFPVGSVDKKYIELIRASEAALSAAISEIKPGMRVDDISKKIWKTAHDFGFGVLTDLGGHGISIWRLHTGIFIPNKPSSNILRKSPKLKKGMILAIEPFLVASEKDSSTLFNPNKTYIFSISSNSLNPKETTLIRLYRKYRLLPFAIRWEFRNSKLKQNLANYISRKLIIPYPVLIEKNRNWVAQSEHTILVKDSSAEILTTSN